ncbi:hypothetical protein AB0O42_16870 [Streptomyces sp. NPDC089922]|uniref:hypothetical protein n=1 Tax=Streptomyces sp. NPDC089922 TaxID=3155189 RepID=UPI0034400D26
MPDLSAARRPHPVVVLVHAAEQRLLAEKLAGALRRIGRNRSRRITAVLFHEATPALVERADHVLAILSPELGAEPDAVTALTTWQEASRGPILLALASGSLGWDKDRGGFTADSAVPEPLRADYSGEPGYADLTTLKGPDTYAMSDADFRRGIGQIASTLYDLPARDQLDGEDIQAHERRRTRRLLTRILIVLLVLGTAVAIPYALSNSKDTARDSRAAREAAKAAEEKERAAAAGRLVDRALKPDADPPELRLLFAAQAFLLGDAQAGPALFTLLSRNDEKVPPFGKLPNRIESDGVPTVIGSDGGVLTTNGIYYAAGNWQPRTTKMPEKDTVLAVSPGGRHAVLLSTESLGSTVTVDGSRHRCAGAEGTVCRAVVLADLTRGTVERLPLEVSALRSGLDGGPVTAPWQAAGPSFWPDVFTGDGSYLLSWGSLSGSLFVVPVADPARTVKVGLPAKPISIQPLKDGTVSVVTERELLTVRPGDGSITQRVPLDAREVMTAVLRPGAREVVLARAGRLDFVGTGDGKLRGSVDTGLAGIQQLVLDPAERTVAATGGGGGALVDVERLAVTGRGPWGVLGTSARFADEAHGSGIEAAFTTDGSRVVLRPLIGEAGWGSPVYIWPTDHRSWYREGCRLAARVLTEEEWRQYVNLAGKVQRACAPETLR